MKSILFAILLLSVTYTSCLPIRNTSLTDLEKEGRLIYQLERCHDSAQTYCLDLLRFGKKVRITVYDIISYLEDGKLLFVAYDTAKIAILQGEFDIASGNIVNAVVRDRTLTPREDSLAQICKKVDSLRSALEPDGAQRYRLIAYIGDDHVARVYIYPREENRRELVWGNDYLVTFNSLTTSGEVRQLHNTANRNAYAASELTSHNHNEDDFFIAADYFRLLKVRDKVTWKQHTIYGKSRHRSWTIDMNTMGVSQLIVP
ncbi:hypothetical protein [Chitinophaga barathri]|uniref:Uncharacterized protein n=1 Tax=Chitinophaga barathri TaxID=1647451 RepID=A0A3N4MM80_9BACT|nr:hypothetical protein [Chitinophaga barathri]RPD43117.1 hypothetical protein EG028_02145 [Chitinophaga barathri]